MDECGSDRGKNATVRGVHAMLHSALDRAAKERLVSEHAKHPDNPCSSPPPERAPCTTRIPWFPPPTHPERRRAGTPPVPRPVPHLRHPGPPERCGHQDGLHHAGTLRRRIHPPHLHPHHPPETGRSRPGHGQPHDTGAMTTSKERKQRTVRKARLPERYAAVFHPCPKGMSWQ